MESGFVICGGSLGCFPLSVGRLSGEAGAKDTDEERDGRREKNSCRQFRGSREPHLTARKSRGSKSPGGAVVWRGDVSSGVVFVT
ncbi:hypothetical protein TNCV_603961 [Trichonephila clavipes]|nr:hypothetical protein TNCV_603961 [Trichonephila clavipes]